MATVWGTQFVVVPLRSDIKTPVPADTTTEHYSSTPQRTVSEVSPG